MLRLFNFIGSRVGLSAAWSVLSWGLPLAALLAGAAGAGWSAWQLGRAPLRAELAELRASHSEAARLAQQASAQRLQAAQERSDSLAAELLATLAENDQLTQEKADALQTATTGRACLSGRTLRVLHGATGITVTGAGQLSAPQPAAAAAHAGAAAAASPDQAIDQLEASDTAVAGWVLNAGNQYEACRARLQSLIDWHADNTQPDSNTASAP